MAGGEALHLALALHRQPALNAECRIKQLPNDVIEVLRVAAGQAEAVIAAVAATHSSADELREAARFYVEQQLLSRESESDPWRVLGVHPGADTQQIREHRRMLIGLVHPDRSADWEAAYADRVNRAWRVLKSAGSLESMEARIAASAEGEIDGWSARTDGWDAEADAPSHGPSVVVCDPPPPSQDRPPSAPHRHRSAAIGATALLGLVAAVVSWGLFSDGLSGDEVLVPMAEPTPAAGINDSISSETNELATLNQQSSPTITADAQSQLDRPRPVRAGTNQLDNSRSNAYRDELAIALAAQQSLDARLQAASDAGLTQSRVSQAKVPPSASENAANESAVSLQVPSPTTARQLVASDDSLAQPGAIAPDHPGMHRPADANSIQVTANVALSERLPEPAALQPRADEAEVRPGTSMVSQQQAPATLQIAGRPAPAVVATQSLVSSTTQPQAGAPMPQLPARPAPANAPEASTSVLPVRADASGYAAKVAVERLFLSFSQTYASGDLNGLVALFSRRANSANGGSLALAADYARLFDTTSDRSIVVNGLAWREEGDTLRGQGSFEARYRKQGRLFKQVVEGTLQFVMVEEAGQLRLLRLDSSGGSSKL